MNFCVVDSLLDQEGEALKGGYLPDDSAIYEADDDDEADQSINPVRAHWHSVNFLKMNFDFYMYVILSEFIL